MEYETSHGKNFHHIFIMTGKKTISSQCLDKGYIDVLSRFYWKLHVLCQQSQLPNGYKHKVQTWW